MFTRAFLISFFLITNACLLNSAHAQDYKTLLDLPPGTTLLHISATAHKEVTQDQLRAHLRYEARDRDVKNVQNLINEKITAALDTSKEFIEVRTATTHYNVYQTQVPPNRADLVWVGSQGVSLESKDPEQLLTLSGKLQELGFSTTSLQYVVSPELLDSTRDTLMESAIEKLRERATRAAKALGKSEADLAEVDVTSGSDMPQFDAVRSFGAEMATARAVAPVAEAGESRISITVSAKALLKP